MATPLTITKFRGIFIAFWLIWATMHALLLTGIGFPLEIAIADSIISNALLLHASVIISNIFRYYLPEKEKLWNVVCPCFALTAITAFINRLLLQHLFPSNTNYIQFLINSQSVRIAIAVLMLGWMALLCILWYTLEDKQEEAQRKAETERLAKEAELLKLRKQLQPHFLFNSLNSINALIGTQPQQARSMIEQLSDFLRGTIKKEEQLWTSVADELQYLQLYLDIEKVRFGYRLTTHITCDEATRLLQLPPLLLQPLVENAIKFGLYDTTGPVTICMEAVTVDHYLQITVQNPFDPETAQPRQGTGFGLSSVQRRLYLLFGRNDLVSTMVQDHQFITTIKIPQSNA